MLDIDARSSIIFLVTILLLRYLRMGNFLYEWMRCCILVWRQSAV